MFSIITTIICNVKQFFYFLKIFIDNVAYYVVLFKCMVEKNKDFQILINSFKNEVRVAVFENNKLTEFYVEQVDSDRIVGNIYMGVVHNIVPAIQAAFIDIGIEKHAFLYVNEICADIEMYEYFSDVVPLPLKKKNCKDDITSLLTVGQEIMVQVVKEQYKNKGPQLTTKCTFAGKYLVHLPYIDHIGISHRIDDESEKVRLLDIVNKNRKDKSGFIVRTQAKNASDNEIIKEIEFLFNKWERLKNQIYTKKAPFLVYKERHLVLRVLRDLLNNNVSSIIVDSKSEFKNISNYLSSNYENSFIKLSLYDKTDPLFDKYSIDKELERVLRKKIWLKNGSYLVIEETEAFTSIDVNSGKFIREVSLEETVFKTNLFAISEIVRIIRLRNISGLIIIDFIDMEKENNRKIILESFIEELKKDRVKVYVKGYSNFGLIEITRKRKRKSLIDLFYKHCPHCRGTGKVKAFKWIKSEIERKILEHQKRFNPKDIIIFVNSKTLDELQDSDFWLSYKSDYSSFVNFEVKLDMPEDKYEIVLAEDIQLIKK